MTSSECPRNKSGFSQRINGAHFFHSGSKLAAFAIILVAATLAGAAEPATITYSQDFPGSDPEHYAITVSQEGHGHYESSGKTSAESESSEPYHTEFELSATSRNRIFELSKQAKFFADKVDSGSAKLAFTGTKALTYVDGHRSNTTKYNYSRLQPVQQLTAFFQNLSSTLEYGRRIDYYRRYQKLALDEELKRMEEQAKEGQLNELQLVRSLLQEIVADQSIINVIRARAQRIMNSAKDNGEVRK